MRANVTRIAAVLLLAASLVAAEGNGETPVEITGPVTMAEPLSGEPPIGYWECWSQLGVWDERLLRSTTPMVPKGPCTVVLFPTGGVMAEIRPEGYGWLHAAFLDGRATAKFDPAGDVFRIPGAGDEAYFSQLAEMRWYAQGRSIWFYTSAREEFDLYILDEDVMALLYYSNPRARPVVAMLFRVGSEAYRANHDFVKCLARNDAVVNRWETERCVDPLRATGLPQLMLSRKEVNPRYTLGVGRAQGWRDPAGTPSP